MNRIDRERFDIRGSVTETFYPGCFHYANCAQQGKLFLRKWRGPRRRSWSMARRARLNPQEIDAIAAGAARAFKLRQNIQSWAGPDRHRPMFDFLIGRAGRIR